MAPLTKGDLRRRDDPDGFRFLGVGVPSPSGSLFIVTPRAGAADTSSAVSHIRRPKVAVWFVLAEPEVPSSDNIVDHACSALRLPTCKKATG